VSCKEVKLKVFFKLNSYSLPGDYDVSVRIRAEPMVKNEMVYWDAKEFHLHIDNLKLFQVNFENLFNGDQELGKLRQL
jgi:hypothetical protein